MEKGYTDSAYLTLYNTINYFDGQTTFQEIKELCRQYESYPNLSLLDMFKIVKDRFGINSRALNVPTIDLLKNNCPCIAYLNVDGGVYVIVKDVVNELITFIHPYELETDIDVQEFNDVWINMIITLEKPKEAIILSSERDYKDEVSNFMHFQKSCMSFLEDIVSVKHCEAIIGLIDKELIHFESRQLSAPALRIKQEKHAFIGDIIKNVKLRLDIPDDYILDESLFIKYGEGQKNSLHYDILNASEGKHKLSVVIYLNDKYNGGQTYFPELKTVINPKQGAALAFRSLDEALQPYSMSIHSGLTVRNGEKYTMNLWFKSLVGSQ